MTRRDVEAQAIEILVVCTANICRSAMAEALLRTLIAERELPATVVSAGLLEGGHERPPEVSTVLSLRGVVLGDGLSRQLVSDDVERADMVLAMERAHVRHAVLLEPEAWPRTFTLKELVRRGEEIGPRLPVESARAWLERAHEGRERHDLLGDSPLDDVADPFGGPSSAYEAAVTEIADLVDRLVHLLWPLGAGLHRLARTAES
ncbi:MAG: arsenate reductase/protein-tyrosine-phosphatase family protein [Acidimicrobiales bacterium]